MDLIASNNLIFLLTQWKKFYPNPVEDVLNIDMNQELENVEVKLYNSSGEIIWINNGVIAQIPFGEYSSGIYFLEIISASNRTLHKIINN